MTSGVSLLSTLVQEPVGVMVSGISMPEMNGMELICSARQFKMDIPILILSSNNNVRWR